MIKNISEEKRLKNAIISLVVIFIFALGAAGAILVNSHLRADRIEKNIESGNNHMLNKVNLMKPSQPMKMP